MRSLSVSRSEPNNHSAIADEELWTDSAPETALWVREALGKLDSSDREILMLREYEQLSYDEIAAVLRLPLNTVRSRLFRSRMALKQHLEPQKRQDAMDQGETCK
jgi:RNA polymerase sigma-70 factor (ECF subfamily)